MLTYQTAHVKKNGGTSIIESISEQLRRELPGLREFSARSIRNMRTFYEYWTQYVIWQPSAAKLQLSINQDTIDIDCFSLQKCSPMASEINREELRNVLPDMDEMRKLLINESDTDN